MEWIIVITAIIISAATIIVITVCQAVRGVNRAPAGALGKVGWTGMIVSAWGRLSGWWRWPGWWAWSGKESAEQHGGWVLMQSWAPRCTRCLHQDVRAGGPPGRATCHVSPTHQEWVCLLGWVCSPCAPHANLASESLWLYGLEPARLLCPGDFLGKNTGVGHHFVLQGIFPTQESSPCLLCPLHQRWILYPLSHQGSHLIRVHNRNW